MHTGRNLSKTEAPYFAEEILDFNSSETRFFKITMVWYGLRWLEEDKNMKPLKVRAVSFLQRPAVLGLIRAI